MIIGKEITGCPEAYIDFGKNSNVQFEKRFIRSVAHGVAAPTPLAMDVFSTEDEWSTDSESETGMYKEREYRPEYMTESSSDSDVESKCKIIARFRFPLNQMFHVPSCSGKCYIPCNSSHCNGNCKKCKCGSLPCVFREYMQWRIGIVREFATKFRDSLSVPVEFQFPRRLSPVDFVSLCKRNLGENSKDGKVNFSTIDYSFILNDVYKKHSCCPAHTSLEKKRYPVIDKFFANSVFDLACLFHQILSGICPFAENDEFKKHMLYHIDFENPCFPDGDPQGWEPMAEHLIKWMLDSNPSIREVCEHPFIAPEVFWNKFQSYQKTDDLFSEENVRRVFARWKSEKDWRLEYLSKSSCGLFGSNDVGRKVLQLRIHAHANSYVIISGNESITNGHPNKLDIRPGRFVSTRCEVENWKVRTKAYRFTKGGRFYGHGQVHKYRCYFPTGGGQTSRFHQTSSRLCKLKDRVLKIAVSPIDQMTTWSSACDIRAYGILETLKTFCDDSNRYWFLFFDFPCDFIFLTLMRFSVFFIDISSGSHSKGFFSIIGFHLTRTLPRH